MDGAAATFSSVQLMGQRSVISNRRWRYAGVSGPVSISVCWKTSTLVLSAVVYLWCASLMLWQH